MFGNSFAALGSEGTSGIIEGDEVDIDWISLKKPQHDVHVRVSARLALDDLPGQSSLVAIHDDMLIVGGNSDIRIHRLADVQLKLETGSRDDMPAADPMLVIEMPERPTFVRVVTGRIVVSFGSMVGVWELDGKTVHRFDVAASVDLLPHPSNSQVAAISPSGVIILNVETLQVDSSFSASSEITSACWSVKGKQIAVGCGDIIQYTPSGEEKDRITAPIDAPLASLQWLENDVFVATYVGDTSEIYVITRSTTGVVFTHFMDPLPPSGVYERSGNYRHVAHVKDWGTIRHLLILSSPLSADIALLGNIEGTWQVLNLEETSRASIPAVPDTYEETSCVGIQLDLTSKAPIKQPMEGGVEQPDLPAAPRVLAYTSEGIIVAYNIVIPTAGPYSRMQGPAATAVQAPSVPPVSTTALSSFSGGPQPAAFGSAFGKPSAFGQPAPATAFGTTTPTSTPSKPFGGFSAFGSSPSSFGSGLGQPSAPSSTTPASTPAKSSAFGSSSPSFGTSGFTQSGEAKPAVGAFGAFAKPVATPSAFGASSFGTPSGGFGAFSKPAPPTGAFAAFGKQDQTAFSGFGKAAENPFGAKDGASAFSKSEGSSFGAFSNAASSPSGESARVNPFASASPFSTPNAPSGNPFTASFPKSPASSIEDPSMALSGFADALGPSKPSGLEDSPPTSPVLGQRVVPGLDDDTPPGSPNSTPQSAPVAAAPSNATSSFIKPAQAFGAPSQSSAFSKPEKSVFGAGSGHGAFSSAPKLMAPAATAVKPAVTASPAFGSPSSFGQSFGTSGFGKPALTTGTFGAPVKSASPAPATGGFAGFSTTPKTGGFAGFSAAPKSGGFAGFGAALGFGDGTKTEISFDAKPDAKSSATASSSRIATAQVADSKAISKDSQASERAQISTPITSDAGVKRIQTAANEPDTAKFPARHAPTQVVGTDASVEAAAPLGEGSPVLDAFQDSNNSVGPVDEKSDQQTLKDAEDEVAPSSTTIVGNAPADGPFAEQSQVSTEEDAKAQSTQATTPTAHSASESADADENGVAQPPSASADGSASTEKESMREVEEEGGSYEEGGSREDYDFQEEAQSYDGESGDDCHDESQEHESPEDADEDVDSQEGDEVEESDTEGEQEALEAVQEEDEEPPRPRSKSPPPFGFGKSNQAAPIAETPKPALSKPLTFGKGFPSTAPSRSSPLASMPAWKAEETTTPPDSPEKSSRPLAPDSALTEPKSVSIGTADSLAAPALAPFSFAPKPKPQRTEEDGVKPVLGASEQKPLFSFAQKSTGLGLGRPSSVPPQESESSVVPSVSSSSGFDNKSKSGVPVFTGFSAPAKTASHPGVQTASKPPPSTEPVEASLSGFGAPPKPAAAPKSIEESASSAAARPPTSGSGSEGLAAPPQAKAPSAPVPALSDTSSRSGTKPVDLAVTPGIVRSSVDPTFPPEFSSRNAPARSCTAPQRTDTAFQPAKASSGSGLSGAFMQAFELMQNDLASLSHTLQSRARYHAAVYDRPVTIGREDVAASRFIPFASLVAAGNIINELVKEAAAVTSHSAEPRAKMAEVQSLLFKTEAKASQANKLHRAKTDPAHAKMMRVRLLGPEHTYNQLRLRKETAAARARIEQLETQVAALARKAEQQYIPLKPPTLDTLNRSVRNIDSSLRQRHADVDSLARKVKLMSLRRSASSTPKPSTPVRQKQATPAKASLQAVKVEVSMKELSYSIREEKRQALLTEVSPAPQFQPAFLDGPVPLGSSRLTSQSVGVEASSTLPVAAPPSVPGAFAGITLGPMNPGSFHSSGRKKVHETKRPAAHLDHQPTSTVKPATPFFFAPK